MGILKQGFSCFVSVFSMRLHITSHNTVFFFGNSGELTTSFGQIYPLKKGVGEKCVILKSFFYKKREREREREREKFEFTCCL